ncbi:uncharacterized protein LOC129222052 [Uloborus diversus]|uniref:uncharacterized protein LOC129222052 n=1 Tax=Uloborus diversus TaxID=327109 RepID=UPI00240944F6|nr:uncharacterized protein LOC129222052 [Uloborus diversus]
MLKHLVLLWAICMYECYKKSNTKLHAGFEEANSIIWDVLLKLPVPLDVYTHHKVFLWWCVATNEQNSMNSSVLYLWIKCGLEDISNASNESMKIVIELLQNNELAKQIFVSLFDFDSEMKAKNVFSFLQQVFEFSLPKHENKVLMINFQDMFAFLIQHIQVGLVKLCIMRKEKISDDEMLCTGLDCLLWCYERINPSDVMLDIKLLMHIIGLCSSSTLSAKEMVSSLRYLKHSVKIETDQRAWHILTGNSKISKFLYYTFKSEVELETLCLLESILHCQVNKNLKSSQHINISFNRFLKWLYFPKSRHPAYSLLSSLIKFEFKDAFVLITN